MRRTPIIHLTLTVLVVTLLVVGSVFAATGTTTRISVFGVGPQTLNIARDPFLSADGRFVAYVSNPSSDEEGSVSPQVMVYDRQIGTAEMVSVDSRGHPGNGASFTPSLSGDGRFVAFWSVATNFVADGAGDGVFVYDRQTHMFERIDVSSTGEAANAGSSYDLGAWISADGRFVVFSSDASNLVPQDTNGFPDVFIRDRQQGTTERVSVSSAGLQGNHISYYAAVNEDGRYVTFTSLANTLVPGDTNGTVRDVFVRDRQSGTTERVSIGAGGAQGNRDSFSSVISADGRFVVFDSEATTLVPNDTNNVLDTFVYDRQTGIIERVSVDSQGNQGNRPIYDAPFISADGRYVTFASEATNMVADNAGGGMFIHDRQTGITTRVSVSSSGVPANGIIHTPRMNGDGRFVAFYSNATNLVAGASNLSVYVHDLQSGATELASPSAFAILGPSSNYFPSISADGRVIAYQSNATNVVAGDQNTWPDILVYDQQTRVTELASVDSAGNPGDNFSGYPAISADGRFVAFWSFADNLVPNDTNGASDIFVHDRQTGATERVSVDSAGNQGNDESVNPAAISADGRFIAFRSRATNLVPDKTNRVADIFVHDRQTGVTERVSVDSAGNPANGDNIAPVISADGRYVGFASIATNLVPDDTNGFSDAFVHDRQTGITERVNLNGNGQQANGANYIDPTLAISADGRFVAFTSHASNLVPGDTNNLPDVFIRDRQIGVTERVSVSSNGDQANAAIFVLPRPTMSGDGRFVAFGSIASNLVPGDTNGWFDVFVRDRLLGVTELASVDSAGIQANGDSDFDTGSAISANGRFVAFASVATNLTSDSTVRRPNIFVRDRGVLLLSQVVDAGGTVTTDSDGTGATPTTPVQTTITTPNAGTVSITEGTPDTGAPSGFAFLGQQVAIEAPDATTTNPLIIVFRIDASQVPPDQDQTTIQLFRNGTQVLDCTGPTGTAEPDPCISDRRLLSDGDVQLTTLTSHASRWNLAAVTKYGLHGFYHPIDMRSNIYNTVKNGASVPLKFEIFAGSNEMTDTRIITIAINKARCETNAIEDPVDVTSSGGTSLRYDAPTGQFIYNWQTPKTPNVCYSVKMTTRDGSTLIAFFKLK